MEPIEILSDDEVIEILSDDDPVQTSTQVSVRQPSMKIYIPAVQPIEVQDFYEGSYNAIVISSSPIKSTRSPEKAPKRNGPGVALLDDILHMSDDSDDDFDIRLAGKSPPKSKETAKSTRKEVKPRQIKLVNVTSSPPQNSTSRYQPVEPLHLDDDFLIPDFSPPEKTKSKLGNGAISPPRRYTFAKTKPATKLTTDKMNDMLQNLESSKDSIVATPRKERFPLFVPNSFIDSQPPLEEDADDEVLMEGHNIILSSSPLREAEEESINNQSSSIGELRLSKIAAKPHIELERLREADQPIYKHERSLETSKVSNPFLDKLLDTRAQDRLKHEQLLRERNRQEALETARNISFYIDRSSRVQQLPIPSSPMRLTSKKQTPPTHDRAKSKPVAASKISLADYTFTDSEDDFSQMICPVFNTAPKEQTVPIPSSPQAAAPVEKRPAKRSNPDMGAALSYKGARALAKATKEQEKEQLRIFKEANKVTRTKSQLLEEMIIDAPKGLMDLLRQKQCDAELGGIQIKESFKIDSYVHWHRKVTSKYDAATDSFIPTDPHIIDESKCCFVFTAKELAEMMEMETLLNRFNNFKRQNKKFDNFMIVIIEYEQLVAKLRNKENKKYTDRVRAQIEGKEPPAENPTKRRKKAQAEDSTNLEELEHTIAELQVNGFKVFPTKNAFETAVWLRSFTYAIAQARYDKLERNPEFSNIGQIKSGKDARDVYFQMLQQFKFMTEARAKRVVDACPSLTELHTHVKNGTLPVGQDGRTLMQSNIEAVVKRTLTTKDDTELLHEVT